MAAWLALSSVSLVVPGGVSGVSCWRARSPWLQLDFRGSQSDDCIVLPHPAYPGNPPPMVGGECNLVVRASLSLPRHPGLLGLLGHTAHTHQPR
eukprot:scaffold23220_cov41-Tisochrysis_lutea.AAC.1